MKHLWLIVIISFFHSNIATATEAYQPKTGDAELDASMIALNKKITKRNILKFRRNLIAEFQVLPERVKELMRQLEFTPADTVMTLSLADATGEPVHNISKSLIENKREGWKFLLYQYEVHQGSAALKQIKQDMKYGFID